MGNYFPSLSSPTRIAMTSKSKQQMPSDRRAERFQPPPRRVLEYPDGKFPVFSPRGDMQNPLYLYMPGHLSALARHLGNVDTTIVLGEVPVGWNVRRRRGLRIPDLIIAFDVDRAGVIGNNGYAIDELGKPPDFVLEVASLTTAENDYTVKRVDYAAFGIPEYWRFDPTGGDRYDAGLAGDRLVDGAYQPLSISSADDAHFWGRSEVIGLDICWEDGQLRWYDPVAQRYLPTFDETEDARIAAEERVRELEAEVRRLRGE